MIPGNPDESGLMISLTRTDSKVMPPRNAAVPQLSANEIELIRSWIQEGAPQ